MLLLTMERTMNSDLSVIIVLVLTCWISSNLAENSKIVYPQELYCVNYPGAECVPVVDCPSVLSVLEVVPRPLAHEIGEGLKQLHCEFHESTPLVCCRKSSGISLLSAPSASSSSQTTSTYPSQSQKPQSQVQPQQTRPLQTPPPSPLQQPQKQLITTQPQPLATNKVPADISTLNDIINSLNTAQKNDIDLLPSPDKCGHFSETRIDKGNLTEAGEYPWAALLQYKTNRGLKFLCGGSLISERYVLTAAYCFTKLAPAELVSVRLGAYYVNGNQCSGSECNESSYQDIEIEEIVGHSEYDQPRWTNDIALIRLSKPAQTNQFVFPICLPKTQEQQEIQIRQLIITGWGTTNSIHNTDKKYKTIEKYVSNPECQKYYRDITITNKQLCIGGDYNDHSCIGDYGSALLYADRKGLHTQLGIFSGINDCTLNSLQPAIHIKVSSYMKWIIENIRR